MSGFKIIFKDDPLGKKLPKNDATVNNLRKVKLEGRNIVKFQNHYHEFLCIYHSLLTGISSNFRTYSTRIWVKEAFPKYFLSILNYFYRLRGPRNFKIFSYFLFF